MKDIDIKSELVRKSILNEFLPTYYKCDVTRKMTHDFYYEVAFRNYVGASKYKSNDAFLGEQTTDDHFLSPRLMIASILNCRPKILNDAVKFREILQLCSQTIKITKKQNNDVKFKNDDNKLIVKSLTIKKYDEFGPWWDNQSNYFDTFPLKDNIPDFFTEFERSLLK